MEEKKIEVRTVQLATFANLYALLRHEGSPEAVILVQGFEMFADRIGGEMHADPRIQFSDEADLVYNIIQELWDNELIGESDEWDEAEFDALKSVYLQKLLTLIPNFYEIEWEMW